jgi:small subunit ribosomal protein S1
MEQRQEETPVSAEAPAAESPEETPSGAPAPEAADTVADQGEDTNATSEAVAAAEPAKAAAPAEPAETSVPAEPVASADGASATPAPEVGPAPVQAKKGKKVTGKIVKIGDDGVFVNFGGREEGVLELKEIQDEKGETTMAVGDEVRPTVLSLEGGIKLTLKGKRPGNLPALLEASQAGTPVEGKVTGVNKGGLVVRTMGVRAFCPFSQIDRRYVEKPEEFVGRKLSFRVSSADEKGRNVILSRRSLLEDEAKEKATEMRKDLVEGADLTGTIARIRPFGAFVDLGGVDGMVHVSEISHARVGHPSELLKVGQEVKVRVVKVEGLGTASERISLSLKRLEPDPWEAAAARLSPGTQVHGKVVRVVDFGAFVEVATGVDGLVHVSALAVGRVDHPSDIVSPGDEVEAWVVQIDRDKRRISLSLVDPAARRDDMMSDRFEERAPRWDRAERGDRSDRGRRRDRESRGPKVHRSGDDSDGLTSMGEAFQRLRERMEDD